MDKGKMKIWVGLGSCLLVGAGSLGAAANAETDAGPAAGAPQAVLIADAAAGGEGGEGGEAGKSAGFADAEGDEAFLGGLMAMKGHLRVGRDLVGQGAWDAAVEHFHHPIEELYEPMEDELEARGIAPFEEELEDLADAVAEKKEAAFQERYSAALAKIEAAAATLDEAKRANPDFVLPVAVLLLRKASEEYGEAVEGGKIVKADEYQDAQGFVWTAEELVLALGDKLKAADRAAFDELQVRFAALKAAWPAVPAQDAAKRAAPVAPADVLANVSRIELTMSRLK